MDLAPEVRAVGKGCNSFAGGTAVLMADGTSKPIDQVNIGDTVTNAQPDNPNVEHHTVTAIHITDTDHDFVDLTIDTLTGPKTITTTAHHLFWDTTTHTWTNAQDLPPGDQLDTPGNGHTTILANHPHTTTLPTYNLTINTLHTYYVQAGAVPVLVHNCGSEASSYFSAYPREFLDQAAKYGKGGVRELSDGQVPFYGEIAKARTEGEMVGRRLVREWNPDSGATRIWHETLDHAGNVRIVRPDVTATGGNKVHYMFDAEGNYTGKW